MYKCSMAERLAKPWVNLNPKAEPGDTYVRGRGRMRILQRYDEGDVIRFVVAPENQNITVPEIARIPNDPR